MTKSNEQAWAQSYGYDDYGRLANVTSPAGAFSYGYAAVSANGLSMAASLVSQLDLPNGAFHDNTYDDLGRLLTTALKDVNGLVLNEHDYVYNEGHQRTKQTFKAGNFVDYTYDNIGQLKTAAGKEVGGVTSRLQEQFSYGYDAAWNLNQRTNNALVQTFTVNSLNELTNATRSGTLTVAGDTTATATSVTVSNLPATIYQDNSFAKDGFTLASGNNTFTAIAQDALGHLDTNTVTVNLPATVTYNYDGNGNLTNDGRRILAYDDENQLTSVIVTNGVGNSTKSEFVYDGMMRRRVRKEYTWSSGSWLQTNEVRYVYDGKLVIQERDANNLPLVSYTRGIDLSSTRQGAGGIGGLLARTDHLLLKAKSTGAHAYYHADGNGNVTAMVDTNQAVVAHYTYDPYGNLLAKSGVLADVNLYRFSSKEYHANLGLYYYGRRFYDPNLQRWVNRDPIEEKGGLNLFRFVRNNPVGMVDPFGLQGCTQCPGNSSECPIHNQNPRYDLNWPLTPMPGQESSGLARIRDLAQPTFLEGLLGTKENVNEFHQQLVQGVQYLFPSALRSLIETATGYDLFSNEPKPLSEMGDPVLDSLKLISDLTLELPGDPPEMGDFDKWLKCAQKLFPDER